MVDLSLILEGLSGASTIAVILGIPFIVLQMRQNAKMVEAANRQSELVAVQNRSLVLLSIAEHMTDHGFILQRKTVRDIIEKYNQKGWESFVDSIDGFEVRAFATQYESAAIMAKLDLIDEVTIMETLGFTIVVDWLALQPAITEFHKVWGHMTFPNFHRLATHSAKFWRERGGLSEAQEKLLAANPAAASEPPEEPPRR
jgi:hypothetical protein